jgi:serine/threonine-protein kinase
VGPRSDIWAVGATMFTLVSARLVHQADTVNELMLAAMTKHAPSIASVVANLPAPVAAVIDRALLYDLNARWPDARSMQAALRTAYQSFDRASIVSGPSGAFRAWQAPPGAPVPPTSAPVLPTVAQVAAQSAPVPGGATAQPVTVGGGVPSARGRFPVLPVVGALAGMLVMGALAAIAAMRHPASGTAATSSASASASALPETVPAPTAAETTTLTADPEPSASTSAATSTSAAPRTAPPANAGGTTPPANTAHDRPSVPSKPCGKFIKHAGCK